MSRDVFEELDQVLGPDRGPDGRPSVNDFLTNDLLEIVETFATRFDDLPALIAGRRDYRIPSRRERSSPRSPSLVSSWRTEASKFWASTLTSARSDVKRLRVAEQMTDRRQPRKTRPSRKIQWWLALVAVFVIAVSVVAVQPSLPIGNTEGDDLLQRQSVHPPLGGHPRRRRRLLAQS